MSIKNQIEELNGTFHSWNVLDEFKKSYEILNLLGFTRVEICKELGLRLDMYSCYLLKLKRYGFILDRLNSEKEERNSSNLRTSAIQVDSLNEILGNIDSQDNSQNNLQFNTKTETKKRTPVKSDLSLDKIAELNALLD